MDRAAGVTGVDKDSRTREARATSMSVSSSSGEEASARSAATAEELEPGTYEISLSYGIETGGPTPAHESARFRLTVVAASPEGAAAPSGVQ